jgi:hypothetical protein
MRSPIRTTRLSVETLDDRIVPAATRLDLTQHGAQISAGGALVRQTDAQPAANFNPIVRLAARGVEQGYNTDARPLQFDERSNPAVTHSITLGQVPTVVVSGTTYRAFVLDLREQAPQLSLDEARIFLGSTGNLSGYDAQTQTLAGQAAVFDLDSGGDVSVIMDARATQGHGFGDVTLLVPNADFAGATAGTYVYLYSKLGGVPGAQADGGAETWAVSLTQAPPTSTGSLSGHLLVDNGAGSLTGISGATITLTDSTGATQTATTDASGNYSFANLAAGTYTIAVTFIPQAFSYLPAADHLGTINGQPAGSSGADDQFTVALGAGQSGINYDFIELLGG